MALERSPGEGGLSSTHSRGRYGLASMAGVNSLHHEDDAHDVEADEVQLCRLVSHQGEAVGQE